MNQRSTSCECLSQFYVLLADPKSKTATLTPKFSPPPTWEGRGILYKPMYLEAFHRRHENRSGPPPREMSQFRAILTPPKTCSFHHPMIFENTDFGNCPKPPHHYLGSGLWKLPEPAHSRDTGNAGIWRPREHMARRYPHQRARSCTLKPQKYGPKLVPAAYVHMNYTHILRVYLTRYARPHMWDWHASRKGGIYPRGYSSIVSLRASLSQTNGHHQTLHADHTHIFSGLAAPLLLEAPMNLEHVKPKGHDQPLIREYYLKDSSPRPSLECRFRRLNACFIFLMFFFFKVPVWALKCRFCRKKDEKTQRRKDQDF